MKRGYTYPNNDFMKIIVKWIEVENITLCEETQSQKKHIWYTFTDKWIWAQKLKLSKIQSTDHMQL